jgi:hypothetical protein
MSIKPGDFVKYVLGKSLVHGAWTTELSDDMGTVISVKDRRVYVLWHGPRLEEHNEGELEVV